jgi:DNA-binding Xre family transcriptional regulator
MYHNLCILQAIAQFFLGDYKMLTLVQVQEALKDRKIGVVAKATGLNYDTVRRIGNGEVKRVSYDAVAKISAYLEGKTLEFISHD